MEDKKLTKMEKDIMKKITKVDNLFEIPTNDKMAVNFDKKYDEEPFQKELKERVELLKDIDKSPYKDKINEVMSDTTPLFGHIKYTFEVFTDNKKYKKITDKKLLNFNKNKSNYKKYQHVFIYYIFEFIEFSYKYLNKGDSCFLKIPTLNINILNTIYLLSLIFDKVYVIGKFIILCQSFKNDKKWIEVINNIKKNNYEFDIQPKKKEKQLIKYLKDIIKIDYYYKKKLIYKQEYNIYKYFKYIENSLLFITLKNKIKELFQNNMTHFLNNKNVLNIKNTIKNNNIINDDDIYLDELK